MNLSFNRSRFFDILQWLQGAMRNNLMQTTHYLTGLDGCGIGAENGISQQFFSILHRIVHVLKFEQLEDTEGDYVYLINALCWSFTSGDHAQLYKLDLFKTLEIGDGSLMHAMFKSFGMLRTNFDLGLTEDQMPQDFSLPCRVNQVQEFLVSTVLESIFVNKEEEKLDVGGEDVQDRIVSKTEGTKKEASEKLLAQICEILIANTTRYLRVKNQCMPEDYHFNNDEDSC